MTGGHTSGQGAGITIRLTSPDRQSFIPPIAAIAKPIRPRSAGKYSTSFHVTLMADLRAIATELPIARRISAASIRFRMPEADNRHISAATIVFNPTNKSYLTSVI